MLYASQTEFAQTNVVSGMLSDTVGGVTESAKRRIAMPFAPTLAETDRVLGHEIVHAFQFDIARRNGGSGSRSGSSKAWLNTWPADRSMTKLACGSAMRS